MVKPRKLFGGLGNLMFQYSYLYSQARAGKIPDIYVQKEEYFAPYKEEIRSLFGQDIAPVDMVSLHVRRGDYNGNPYYVDLTETDYYDEAMEQFPGAKFLVFCADRQLGSNDSADMDWCKEHFKGKQFAFYQGADEIKDFNMMAGCTGGHIIANSSFSWWAAYVSGNKTVAPKKWFADGTRINTPNEWITI